MGMLSPDGSNVLTNSMDGTVRIFDIQPFCTGERCLKVLTGHTHNFEKNLLHCAWSPDGGMAAAGSSDRNVHLWDVDSQKLVYKLPVNLNPRARGPCQSNENHPKLPADDTGINFM